MGFEVGSRFPVHNSQLSAANVRGAAAACCLSLVVASCGDDGHAPLLGPTTTGESVGDCDGTTEGTCDVQDSACREHLAEIAACLFGGDGTEVVLPPVDVISVDELEEALRDDYTDADDEFARYRQGWAWAFETLGFASDGGLDAENQAQRQAQNIAATYDPTSKRITLVTPEEEFDEAYDNSIFIHELIHAQQDHEHDLNRISNSRVPTSDSYLAWRSMVEGEAELHQVRAYVGLIGLRESQVDLRRAFTETRHELEAWMLDEGELLLDMWVVVPYGYGALWALDVWEEDGAKGLRDAIDDPSDSAYELLARVWGENTEASLAQARESGDWQDFDLYDYDSLGAWGVYLLSLRQFEDSTRAEDLGSRWRADRIELFEAAEGEGFALRWHFIMADEDAADELAALFDEAQIGNARVDDVHVYIDVNQSAERDAPEAGDAGTEADGGGSDDEASED